MESRQEVVAKQIPRITLPLALVGAGAVLVGWFSGCGAGFGLAIMLTFGHLDPTQEARRALGSRLWNALGISLPGAVAFPLTLLVGLGLVLWPLLARDAR